MEIEPQPASSVPATQRERQPAVQPTDFTITVRRAKYASASSPGLHTLRRLNADGQNRPDISRDQCSWIRVSRVKLTRK
jgi:hypothetical protein